MTTLHSELRKKRLKLGLTLRDVAKASRGAISNPYYSNLERGRIAEPSPLKLRACAFALRLDYIQLLHLAGYLTRAEKESLS